MQVFFQSFSDTSQEVYVVYLNTNQNTVCKTFSESYCQVNVTTALFTFIFHKMKKYVLLSLTDGKVYEQSMIVKLAWHVRKVVLLR